MVENVIRDNRVMNRIINRLTNRMIDNRITDSRVMMIINNIIINSRRDMLGRKRIWSIISWNSSNSRWLMNIWMKWWNSIEVYWTTRIHNQSITSRFRECRTISRIIKIISKYIISIIWLISWNTSHIIILIKSCILCVEQFYSIATTTEKSDD